MARFLRALPCLLLLAILDAAAQSPVVVYRCVDASGHVSLGDVPCAGGAREEVKSMQRPVDGPPLRVAAPALAEPREPASPRTVYLRTPQPMYECVTPEGSRYTSETGDGNPRWVPLWTLGYSPRGGRGHRDGSGGRTPPEPLRPGPLGGYVGAPRPTPGPAVSQGHRPPHRQHIGAGGTWIRDTCHPLPQHEVCSRLLERRDAIRKRFFNAQEGERDTLRVEERGINARLDADCGATG